MKKTIGIIAAVGAIIDIFIFMILIVTDNAFANQGFTGFIFVMWFVLLGTAIFCLLGDFIKFIGKQFSAGYNSTAPGTSVFCSNCGKSMDAGMAFCPHCGAKR